MGSPIFLEDFSQSNSHLRRNRGGQTDQEAEIRLEGFDAGYEAGFEDAKVLSEQDRNQLTKDLAETLKKIELTENEIIQQVLSSVSTVVGKILERLSKHSVDALLCQKIREIIDAGRTSETGLKTKIKVHSGSVSVVQDFFSRNSLRPLEIVGDEELTSNQAIAEMGDFQTLIDIDAVFDEVHKIISASVQAQESKSK